MERKMVALTIGTNVKGILSNVYGPYLARQKQAFLDSLGRLGMWVGQRHWVIGGDFNLI
jgi:hypothetical protein